MKKPDRVTAVFGAVVISAALAAGAVSVSAAGGDQEDPLVTLSYLTQVVTPELMGQVDKQYAANEQALTERLNAAIDRYSQEMEALLAPQEGESASYVTVTLSEGQTLTLQAGCELLPRSGEAAVSAGESPALLDTTAGGTLEDGGALEANHLYLPPLDGTEVTAGSDCLFLVCGPYTVSEKQVQE